MSSIASIPLSDIFQMSLVTALMLGLGHYFPWHEIFGRPDDGTPMPRIHAYVYGVMAIMAPLIYIYLLWGSQTEALLMAVNVLVAGVSTVGCYLYDRYRFARRIAKETGEREKLLSRKLDEIEDQTL